MQRLLSEVTVPTNGKKIGCGVSVKPSRTDFPVTQEAPTAAFFLSAAGWVGALSFFDPFGSELCGDLGGARIYRLGYNFCNIHTLRHGI